MATSRAEIVGWIERGIKEKKTHLIVVCDTYDYDDYPVYVDPGQDARKVFDAHNGNNMQRVMEVYNLAGDIPSQLAEHRSFNF